MGFSRRNRHIVEIPLMGPQRRMEKLATQVTAAPPAPPILPSRKNLLLATRPPKPFPNRRDEHDNRRSHDKPAAVWRAMSRSSSVGTAQTETAESSALIRRSLREFRSESRTAPIHRDPFTTSARVIASCSPIPPENTSASMPPNAATSD